MIFEFFFFVLFRSTLTSGNLYLQKTILIVFLSTMFHSLLCIFFFFSFWFDDWLPWSIASSTSMMCVCSINLLDELINQPFCVVVVFFSYMSIIRVMMNNNKLEEKKTVKQSNRKFTFPFAFFHSFKLAITWFAYITIFEYKFFRH